MPPTSALSSCTRRRTPEHFPGRGRSTARRSGPGRCPTSWSRNRPRNLRPTRGRRRPCRRSAAPRGRESPTRHANWMSAGSRPIGETSPSTVSVGRALRGSRGLVGEGGDARGRDRSPAAPRVLSNAGCHRPRSAEDTALEHLSAAEGPARTALVDCRRGAVSGSWGEIHRG